MKAPSTGWRGFKWPWWLTALFFGLALAMLLMHGRVAAVDRPFFHIGPVGVTAFGILFTIASGLVLLSVRNFLDSLHATLTSSKVLVAVELLLVIGGVLFILDVLGKLLGYDLSLSDGASSLLAGGVRAAGTDSPEVTP